MMAVGVLAMLLGSLTGDDVAGASSPTTVFYDGAGPRAPRIGLVGDSTLSGVRWYDDYGDLERFNFVFDAESCRRTLETSCWSREDYRPENAVSALRRLHGRWGDLLVVMSGYNDSSYLFDDAVDAVVEEARSQGVPKVMWLSLRTSDVAYEEPMHQANGNTYDEANAALFEKSDEYGGYLQIADWATYAADRPDWFEYDGVHLTPEGVDGLTTFIADQAHAVLSGHDVTPADPPWETLELGDVGSRVASAQRALREAGVESFGGVDGRFGRQTATAVGAFQAEHGLDVTRALDIPTAVALGLYEPPAFMKDVLRPLTDRQASTARQAASTADDTARGLAHLDFQAFDTVPKERTTTMLAVAAAAVGVVAMLGGGAAFVGQRRHHRRRSNGGASSTRRTSVDVDADGAGLDDTNVDGGLVLDFDLVDDPTLERAVPPRSLARPALYDHEREEQPAS